MEIKDAIWYLSDYGHITLSSDLREAVVTVLDHVKKLEKKIEMLEETKEK